MTTKYTFFIGLNDKDTRTQNITTLAARDIVERIFISHKVEGATISEGRGVYRYDNGDISGETTLIVTVFIFGEDINVSAICNDLKTILNQESIAVEKRETESALY